MTALPEGQNSAAPGDWQGPGILGDPENLWHRGSSWWGGTAPGPPQTPSHCWAWLKEAVPKTQRSPALPGWGCWHPPGLEKQGKRRLRKKGIMRSSPKLAKQIHTVHLERLCQQTRGAMQNISGFGAAWAPFPWSLLPRSLSQARGMLVLMAAGTLAAAHGDRGPALAGAARHRCL